MKIGVCYYPEHWPEEEWSSDAKNMFALGIRVVRIGEFAWSRIEPNDGVIELEWLQRAISTLGDAGLQVVLGTPTATPPKWLVDKHKDILAVDASGQTRGFGSRRHYCFSSLTYREECRRIVEILAQAFGPHPSIIGWQTDNEYGCHDTIASFSAAARDGFRQWCKDRYASIDDLNSRWGNVFWSMEYQSFDEIDLPVGTVTEPNPAHQLAFWRYSSDQVKAFNRVQTTILRKHCPDHLLIHNYMGNFPFFDHYDVAEDLDVAAWDNYPLGFLDRDGSDPEELRKWYRTGHPDSSALHHDLYRGVGKGRWWVMEQQPGPVNWAPHNPSPLAGMVRLWGWEAIAHGAEVVAYFRWRQAPFAQEQTHTGLCLPTGDPDTGAEEVQVLARELESINSGTSSSDTSTTPTIAILFDYCGNAMQDIGGYGGASSNAFERLQELYTACRRTGLNIDIVNSKSDLAGYAMVLLHTQVIDDAMLIDKLRNLHSPLVLLPGTGSRDSDFTMPATLQPGNFRSLIDVTVTRSESLPSCADSAAETPELCYQAKGWRERISSRLNPEGYFNDGWGFHYTQGNVHYLNAWLAPDDLYAFIRKRAIAAGLAVRDTDDGLRYRQLGHIQFAFNYGPSAAILMDTTDFILGQSPLKPGELAAWSIGKST